jgi:acyl carrier protein
VSTMYETIEERVLRIISTSRRLPLAAVQRDSTFVGLGIDSLDRLNILFDLESEFNIEIDDEEAKKATKISEVIEGIEQLVDGSESPSPGH